MTLFEIPRDLAYVLHFFFCFFFWCLLTIYLILKWFYTWWVFSLQWILVLTNWDYWIPVLNDHDWVPYYNVFNKLLLSRIPDKFKVRIWIIFYLNSPNISYCLVVLESISSWMLALWTVDKIYEITCKWVLALCEFHSTRECGRLSLAGS